MRRITLLMTASVILLLLSMCAIFWQTKPSGGPVKITVTFSGFTNDGTGFRFAAFRVSNPSGARLFRWPFYAIEENGQVAGVRRASFARGATLAPGQSSVYLLPVPTSEAPWRAVFHFSRDNWRRKLAGMPSWVRGVVPSRLLALPVQEGLSEWIGATASTPPPPRYRDRLASVLVRGPLASPQTNGTGIAPPAQK